MPKTTIKKKPSKPSVFKNISLKSRKGKMLAILFVFVAVGTGIVIRSFAAIPVSTFMYKYNNITTKSSGLCSLSRTYDSQFKTDISSMNCKTGSQGQGEATVQTQGAYLSPGNYRLCMYAKGKGYIRLTLMNNEFQVASQNYTKDQWFLVNSSTYVYRCTNYLTKYRNANLYGYTSIYPGNAVQWVNIGAMVIEKQ
jgi:hypothetical protein